MNDADRAEVALMWNAMCLANPRIGRSILDGEMVEMLAAAKRKWEKAAANAKLEEAALALADHGAESDIINGVVGSCIRRIRALKQE